MHLFTDVLPEEGISFHSKKRKLLTVIVEYGTEIDTINFRKVANSETHQILVVLDRKNDGIAKPSVTFVSFIEKNKVNKFAWHIDLQMDLFVLVNIWLSFDILWVAAGLEHKPSSVVASVHVFAEEVLPVCFVP